MRRESLTIGFLSILLAVVVPKAGARPIAASPEASPAGAAVESSNVSPLLAGNSLIIAKAVVPEYTIRHTVPEVRIQFTVADDRGRLLQSISSGDFRVLDNRAAVLQIREFSRLSDLPLEVGILLDVSDSVQKAAARQRQAAHYFVQHVLQPQTDRAALIAFSNEVKLWQPPTGDRDELNAALSRVQQLGFATYLYDGVYRACHDQFSSSPEGDHAQHILVLITDGFDTGSLHTLADAISAAQHRDIQIFALSVHSARLYNEGDNTLRQMADATGGQFFLANSEKDFPAVFAAMEQQMRTQYAVSFLPAAQTPGFHSVKIEMAGRQAFRVRARQGYFYDAP